MSEVKYREMNLMCLSVPVDTLFEASSFFFFLVQADSHVVFAQHVQRQQVRPKNVNVPK